MTSGEGVLKYVSKIFYVRAFRAPLLRRLFALVLDGRRLTNDDEGRSGAESVSGACSVGAASLKTFFGALDVLNA